MTIHTADDPARDDPTPCSTAPDDTVDVGLDKRRW